MRHFNTYEHYNDMNETNITIKKNKKKRKMEDCFICYEMINNNKKPIRLKSECYYIKKCTCDGWIHKGCLDYWYSKKEVCPICRNNIYKNSDIMVKIYKFNYNLFVLIIFLKNNAEQSKRHVRNIKNGLRIALLYFLYKFARYIINYILYGIHNNEIINGNIDDTNIRNINEYCLN